MSKFRVRLVHQGQAKLFETLDQARFNCAIWAGEMSMGRKMPPSRSCFEMIEVDDEGAVVDAPIRRYPVDCAVRDWRQFMADKERVVRANKRGGDQ